MLPDGVREMPRAYLVPPRHSKTNEKKHKYRANNHTTSSQLASTRSHGPSPFAMPQPPAATTSPPGLFPPWQYGIPPAHPIHGEPEEATWSFGERRWKITYAGGVQEIGIQQTPFVSFLACSSVSASFYANFVVADQQQRRSRSSWCTICR